MPKISNINCVHYTMVAGGRCMFEKIGNNERMWLTCKLLGAPMGAFCKDQSQFVKPPPPPPPPRKR